MAALVCPHCKERRLVMTRVPKDVVAVMPCPSCHELAVLFRDKVIPLSRRIIEDGSLEERSSHFAKVIAEFLEVGLFPIRGFQAMRKDSVGDAEATATDADSGASLITERELEHFVRVDLKSLDDSTYFRKNFGQG